MSENKNNPFNYEQIDEMLSSRIRLAVLALLAGCEEAEFTYIRDMVGASDGNLASHLRKLEDADYVTLDKRFLGRKPATFYRITTAGQSALLDYSRHLAELLSHTQKGGTP
ncbi:MAG TPA: transcriptional regulator [Treponema sp.]|nr:transcriptional regulator [Treponema sp.]HRS05085.1 transcriptional regulator [Treponema sp.]